MSLFKKAIKVESFKERFPLLDFDKVQFETVDGEIYREEEEQTWNHKETIKFMLKEGIPYTPDPIVRFYFKNGDSSSVGPAKLSEAEHYMKNRPDEYPLIGIQIWINDDLRMLIGNTCLSEV